MRFTVAIHIGSLQDIISITRSAEIFPPENLCIFLVAGATDCVQSAFAFARGRKFLERRASIAQRIEAFHWLPVRRKALNLHRASVAD